jgi:hypothetical protein
MDLELDFAEHRFLERFLLHHFPISPMDRQGVGNAVDLRIGKGYNQA